MKTALLAPALLGAALGCGGMKGRDYAGEPLTILEGSVTSRVELAQPYRLALAWRAYDPTRSLGDLAPVSYVAQGISVPSDALSYVLPVYEPPPETAFPNSELNDTRRAEGWLVAYEDLNGNGELDLIPSGGTPVDRVLGSSEGDLLNPKSPAGWVVYSANEAEYVGEVRLRRGFNILRQASPLSPVEAWESLPLALTGDASENRFVCADTNDLSCYCTAADHLIVDGEVSATGAFALGQFRVHACGGGGPATVKLNRVALPFDAQSGEYALTSNAGPPQLHQGINALEVTLDRHAPLALGFEVAPLTFLAPVSAAIASTQVAAAVGPGGGGTGTVLPAGQPLEVRWGQALSRPSRLRLTVYPRTGKDTEAPFVSELTSPPVVDIFPYSVIVEGTQTTIPAERMVPGMGKLSVQTEEMGWKPNGSRIRTSTGPSATLEIRAIP